MNQKQFEFLLASYTSALAKGLTTRGAFVWALEYYMFVYDDGPVLLSSKAILDISEVPGRKEVRPAE